MPHTAKSWLQILLLCTMAGASVAVEPSRVLVGFGWTVALLSTYFFHWEREDHQRTLIRERQLLDRQVTRKRHDFPEMILN